MSWFRLIPLVTGPAKAATGLPLWREEHSCAAARRGPGRRGDSDDAGCQPSPGQARCRGRGGPLQGRQGPRQRVPTVSPMGPEALFLRRMQGLFRPPVAWPVRPSHRYFQKKSHCPRAWADTAPVVWPPAVGRVAEAVGPARAVPGASHSERCVLYLLPQRFCGTPAACPPPPPGESVIPYRPRELSSPVWRHLNVGMHARLQMSVSGGVYSVLNAFLSQCAQLTLPGPRGTGTVFGPGEKSVCRGGLPLPGGGCACGPRQVCWEPLSGAGPGRRLSRPQHEAATRFPAAGRTWPGPAPPGSPFLRAPGGEVPCGPPPDPGARHRRRAFPL